jgi:hypothetical protein
MGAIRCLDDYFCAWALDCNEWGDLMVANLVGGCGCKSEC